MYCPTDSQACSDQDEDRPVYRDKEKPVKTKLNRCCVAATLLLLASACANQNATSSMADNADRTCINVHSINSFSSLSDRELLVTASVKDHYLLTVDGYCPGLRDAHSVAVIDSLNRICNDGFGRVVFEDRSFGPQSCRVNSIEPVMNRDEAREIVTARRDARRNQ